jgi:hypothetical protein
MTKNKKKLTSAQKAAKQKRRKEFMTIFINGKQKRVRRPPTIDGMDVDEFIRRNADPVWLLQDEMYEELYAWELDRDEAEVVQESPTEDIPRDDVPRQRHADKRKGS